MATHGSPLYRKRQLKDQTADRRAQ